MALQLKETIFTLIHPGRKEEGEGGRKVASRVVIFVDDVLT